MTVEEAIRELEESVSGFRQLIQSLPPELFLKRFTEWAARDVLAHLIGWNRYTLRGCEQLKRGESPFYLDDPGENFNKINSALVREYSSTDQGKLLAELDASLEELVQSLRALIPAEWSAGIKYKRWNITIQDSVEALIKDYNHHREQIEGWKAG